jgi:ribonuclease BN (tRNA processing enzyme)
MLMRASRSFLSLSAIAALALFGAVAVSHGQSESLKLPDEARMKAGGGTRLVLLGTAGGPIIRKFRSQPASLLIVKGTPYLIDAGAGTLRQLAWAGVRPRDLGAIFITHNHLDHNADVGSIISFNWVERRSTPLPIVGPYGTAQLADAALAYFQASERIYGTERGEKFTSSDFVRARDITGPGLVYQDENIKVTAVENSHYSTFDAGKDKSYAYRIDAADRSIVFTGDTGPSDAVAKLAQGADVLVSEVIDAESTIVAAATDTHEKIDMNSQLAVHMRQEHLAPEEIGKMAAKAGVKMVVLNHLAPGLDNETDMSGYSAGVRKYFKGPVIVGRDLLEL